jgi:hypothetical protein
MLASEKTYATSLTPAFTRAARLVSSIQTKRRRGVECSAIVCA